MGILKTIIINTKTMSDLLETWDEVLCFEYGSSDLTLSVKTHREYQGTHDKITASGSGTYEHISNSVIEKFVSDNRVRPLYLRYSFLDPRERLKHKLSEWLERYGWDLECSDTILEKIAEAREIFDPPYQENYTFEGEDYRDDRIFVANLSRGTVTNGDGEQVRWLVCTYRNTRNLPARSTHHFSTRQEAIDFIKHIEPLTPLVSKRGLPLDISTFQDSWETWFAWLQSRSLASAISGYQHLPAWVRRGGRAPQNDYVEVFELSAEDFASINT